MMDINPLSVKSLSNIFSHSVGCLFVSLMVSFAVQKFYIKVPFVFILFLFPWRDISKNIAAIYVKECTGYVFL